MQGGTLVEEHMNSGQFHLVGIPSFRQLGHVGIR
jgi:hypothetical protein